MGQFQKGIAAEIARIEGKQKEQEESKRAEEEQRQKARERARMVRDKIIIPLLNELRDDLANHEKKVLPNWDVRSDATIDEFSGTAVTPEVSGTGVPLPSFTITAQAATEANGTDLNMSVECSYTVAEESSGVRKSVPLKLRKQLSIQLVGFHEPCVRDYFCDQLAECTRLCLEARMNLTK